ncbi:MAG: ATP-dependent RNA helicase HrpA [Deltaproteobacteria bacterium]|nr:ATP-dependent RNA helicase HrpA [Deltaproteobacteria bacterium]
MGYRSENNLQDLAYLIKQIESGLAEALLSDQYRICRQLRRIKCRRLNQRIAEEKLLALKQRLDRSIEKRALRIAKRPCPSFNEALPITAKKEEIIEAIKNHQVLIISGETGSGKSTQIPKFCLAADRGIDGVIGCTQPRRIAATTVSERIAEELGEAVGQSVGYKIRFKERTNPLSFIKLMTDGILLAETQSDPHLTQYDTIIVDEAHERSLNIDFILGILRKLIKIRKELKLIITSATIDTEKFSDAFDKAPVIEVSGRTYPVEVRYLAEEEKGAELTHIDMAVEAVDTLQRQNSYGDVLIFMPTEQDIRECCETLEGRDYRGVTVLPLYARLTGAEQKKVFSRFPGRKIIVATNVAETSITIPGIKYVVDTGLARISQYSPTTRTTSLPVSAISKSSAEQRKGRCGRVENGVCIRLYTEKDYESRPVFTPPEILRSNLAEVILRMIALKLGNISLFPFIDPPRSKNIQDGFNLLVELGAIEPKRSCGTSRNVDTYSLTERGRLMAKLPIDPRLSRMLIQAQQEDCLEHMLIIASALTIQDPRERPAEKATEADLAHKAFEDENSDFISLLRIWKQYHEVLKIEQTTSAIRRFCKQHFLSYTRMQEWRDIHRQILLILKEAGISISDRPESSIEGMDPNSGLYRSIHRSILSGFLSNVGQKKEKNIYKAAKGREVMIFPGSGLFNRGKQWIVAAEMVETSRLFARCAANIDATWILDIGSDQCSYTYHSPHWNRSRGEVIALEQVSLYALVVVTERPISYGAIKPEEATDIFICEALLSGDIEETFGFLKHNLALIREIREIENRIRRRDLLVGEEKMVRFYAQRLSCVYDVTTLRKRIEEEGSDEFLRMTRGFLLRYEPDKDEIARFPDTIMLGNHPVQCHYRYEPGQADDGVTIRLPATVASAIPPDSVDWLVPGLFEEKITAMIKGLPKPYRKRLVPASKISRTIAKEMPKSHRALASCLSKFVFKRFGVDIPASSWPAEELEDHLRMRICLTDTAGNEIRCGRDKTLLMGEVFEPNDEEQFRSACLKWEKPDIKKWDFEDLPETVQVEGKDGSCWIYFLALVKENNAVNLRLFRHREKAMAAHRRGVAALYSITHKGEFKFLRKMLRLPVSIKTAADYFGGKKEVEKQIFESVVSELFCKNIRSQNDFERHAKSATASMFKIAKERMESTVAVLLQYEQTRSLLAELEAVNKTNRLAADFLKGLRHDISQLAPANFLELYDSTRLKHLSRYLKAIAIRARKGIVDFERDRSRALQLQPYKEVLDRFLKELNNTASEEKLRMIEEFFWLIEEYKVSLFAQELKTAVPVSRKRLDSKIQEINRML